MKSKKDKTKTYWWWTLDQFDVETCFYIDSISPYHIYTNASKDHQELVHSSELKYIYHIKEEALNGLIDFHNKEAKKHQDIINNLKKKYDIK